MPTLNATYFLPKDNSGKIGVKQDSISLHILVSLRSQYFLLPYCINFALALSQDPAQQNSELEKNIGDIDAVLIAPLGANMMARLATPLADRPGKMSDLVGSFFPH